MIIETKFMTLDVDEVVSVSIGKGIRVIFKSAAAEFINYDATAIEEMNEDYKKITDAMKQRDKS
jgi:hypothetical protein